jgi:hypothetical protein
MLNSTHFRLFGALIGGFWGAAAAMDYQPFPNCTETAQVDSSRELVYMDATLDPDLAPYTGHEWFRYFPRSCYPMQIVQQPYHLPDRTYRVDYHQGPTPGVFEFVWTVTGDDSGFITGTAYLSTLGEMDSTWFRFTQESETGRFDTIWAQQKTIRTPQYQLIRTYERGENGPWEFSWGDSIVATAAGKTIYSVEGEDTVVTRCGDNGPTYVCEESPSSNGMRPRKSIWFLTQGRKDSLQVWEGMVLVSTETYFWSGRSAGIRSPRVRMKGPAAASVWNEFDIMGRTRSHRSTTDRAKPDRNKTWPRMRY